MSMSIEQAKALVDEVLEVYPEAAKKDRTKHMTVNDSSVDSAKCVVSNRKSVPGVMTVRGCAYAGSRGVVWGPIKDIVHISHGPVGCGQYSRAGRRNYYTGVTGVDSFATINFTTDFQERDIVFGGDKKLSAAIDEIETLFPLNKGISVQSECPVGLIGDDIEAVARMKGEEIGKKIFPVRCEGFRGVSQSLGHHIANDVFRDYVLEDDADSEFETTDYDVAIVGDYNIGGDAWASRIILEDMGLRVVAQWSGDGTLPEMENTSKVKLNLVHCYRSMNYVTRYMEEKYNIPWMEYNLFGPTKIEESMRKIAAFFDEKIQKQTEDVIARYKEEWDAVIAKYRPRLEGKSVMLYVGGLRPRHIIGAYEDLGMEVVGAGYEFAHNDDYVKTIPDIKDSTILFDDASAYELEEFAKALKPDVIGSGVKEKYVFQKMGIPFRQMHSWDYSGPYHGVDGFAIFARDMDMTINNPVWSKMKAPWLAQQSEDEALAKSA
ncbi:nitrogenase molybdenum-iron protein alpha chain [Vibrio salinus]|uniref:nitrogenase molybdenum-iron protein alpha chain n=1 Tax=Vibrio salinus TaxID=2899784 RepID=UPI001E500A78|nr:nitrogenase molybdenum-iron protein alpha chain [Vibrio salinus]MCE0495407.1 nitrogenase molybdenum-iron protein alpha chain [Vibrio salinus]